MDTKALNENVTEQEKSIHCVSIAYSSYRAFGAVGYITSGAGRDLDQVRQLGIPAFTVGIISAHGYCHCPIPDIHVPVCVGGLVAELWDRVAKKE